MKAQLAIEFVFLVAVAFLIMIVYTASTRQDLLMASSSQEHALVKDLAYSLQSEVNIAGLLENGYQRSFDLPSVLDGHAYSVVILQDTLIVNTSNYEHVLSVLPVLGNFTIGSNTIKKQSDRILLNT